ncbi:MAG TPA: HEAT repeat domain-containing protein [Thermoanaerobaculia bacterium]|nr:HEAT repeat domain-containing protein [Thermoanaerobaculia bacterium]
MSCDEIAETIVDSWNGTLDEAAERALAAHLAECADCRAEAERLRRLWSELAALPDPEPGPRVRERFESMLAAELAREAAQREGGRVLRPEFLRPRAAVPAWRGWRLAAGLAAALAVGVFVGTEISGRKSDGEMAALQQEVASLHETVTRALLAGSSPSERLRGVAYGRDNGGADPRVTDAFLEALRSDPDVNVRLAALEALRPLAGRPAERPRLVAALDHQASPLVQLSLVEVLLSSGDDAAREDLEPLLSNPELDPAVRGYLRGRLGGTT